MWNTCKSPQVSSRSYLRHLCQTFICLLFSNGTQMKFNLFPRRVWGVHWISLFESQGDFFQGPARISRKYRKEEAFRKAAWRFLPMGHHGALLLVAVLPVETPLESISSDGRSCLLIIYILTLIERDPASHCHRCVLNAFICMWFDPPDQPPGLSLSPMPKLFLPEEFCGVQGAVRSWSSFQPPKPQQQQFFFFKWWYLVKVRMRRDRCSHLWKEHKLAMPFSLAIWQYSSKLLMCA